MLGAAIVIENKMAIVTGGDAAPLLQAAEYGLDTAPASMAEIAVFDGN
jgi:hypothetical protein